MFTIFAMNKCSKMRYRKRRYRKLLNPPTIKGFKPYGRSFGIESLEVVSMLFEEYESIKLCDYDMLTHLEASALMGISRPTFTRIYSSARQKIALALTQGRQLIIEGGKIYYDSDWFHCKNCNSEFSNPHKESVNIKCALCGSTDIEKIQDADISNEENIDSEDLCTCPKCGYIETHIANQPCNKKLCPSCNINLKRKQ